MNRQDIYMFSLYMTKHRFALTRDRLKYPDTPFYCDILILMNRSRVSGSISGSLDIPDPFFTRNFLSVPGTPVSFDDNLFSGSRCFQHFILSFFLSFFITMHGSLLVGLSLKKNNPPLKWSIHPCYCSPLIRSKFLISKKLFSHLCFAIVFNLFPECDIC